MIPQEGSEYEILQSAQIQVKGATNFIVTCPQDAYATLRT